MDMDGGIEFGDVEEEKPDVQLRPDRNRHFAIAEYESPSPDDLAVFVDLDVLMDMERHALDDTTVELGGVMLGGQYEDEDGKPFVVITDSLRAQHYESTKGSFKFTHDTWSEISREREGFSDDLQMVGWYHTHPDWGVFLSGMDMFICDNFFNKTLDVALVIDPCRDDRAFFQWTGNPSQRVRRTRGFYVMASRFREEELELVTSQLESEVDMNDPRHMRMGQSSPPVVNIHGDRSQMVPMVMMGMLTIQMLFFGLFAWKMLGDGRSASPEYLVLQAKQEAIKDIAKELGQEKPELVDQVEQANLERLQQQMVSEGLYQQVLALNKAQKTASTKFNKTKEKLDAKTSELEKKKAELKDKDELIKELKGEAPAKNWWTENWVWIGAALIAVGFVAIVVFTMGNEKRDVGYLSEPTSPNDEPLSDGIADDDGIHPVNDGE